MRQWKLSLLGPVRLTAPDGGRIIRLGAKMKGLLAFLAIQPGGWAERESLAQLLWDESAEPEARHCLRQVLSTLRRRLGEDADRVLHADYDGVGLALESLDIDLRRFEAAIEGADQATAPGACLLWSGAFCQGLDARSEAFEEWLLLERARLEELAAAGFRRVAETQLEAGRFGSAVSAAHRCVVLNPFDEGAHAALIDLYRRLGWAGPARSAHRRCVKLFRRELGERPGRMVEEALTAPLGS